MAELKRNKPHKDQAQKTSTFHQYEERKLHYTSCKNSKECDILVLTI